MKKKKVLFVCIHNSARSQMAEAFLHKYGNEYFTAESAGFEPGDLNPLAVEVMQEEGIDISNNTTDSVFDFYKQGKFFGYIVKVCDESKAKSCPIFPGLSEQIFWKLDDPSKFTGSYEEKLDKTRKVRDQIKANVKKFIDEKAN